MVIVYSLSACKINETDEIPLKSTPAVEFKSNGFNNDLAHKRGVLSMARSMMPNSAGSQFFIMHMDAPYLDGAYAAFGCVIEGMEVVDEIATTKTDYTDRPLRQQKIEKMTVETFGVEYPAPKTL